VVWRVIDPWVKNIFLANAPSMMTELIKLRSGTSSVIYMLERATIYWFRFSVIFAILEILWDEIHGPHDSKTMKFWNTFVELF
jgi:uncharacterized membrane protein